ncbi:hypothetical protein B0T22DRAFT_467900 [Podospora appendiculata]|uniref:NAD(P)-binding domain-containing protein n=1 Tax=Podospora appendiculata TaxID=314037 RepID=A0AAE0X2A1_9PEZI|nr:hypothetical protein B0T22DRAFT_467900 [Podospora appendiculata]
MKLIVGGSTGFVATEIIRQALSNPAVTSIIALGRRETPVPPNAGPGADETKLKSVRLSNFENYSEGTKKELAGADACIWTLAVTPSKYKSFPWDDVVKVCRDYTAKAIETMSQLPRGDATKPFRFIYVSGVNSERDQTKKPLILGDYCLMRGAVETLVLDYAQQSKGTVEACIAKPGVINALGHTRPLWQKGFYALIGLPNIQVSEIAASLLHQAINGAEKDTLSNEDMVEMRQRLLAENEQAADAGK